MQYFRKVHDEIAVAPFLEEIAALADVWTGQAPRQPSAPVQREAPAIVLRGLRKSLQGDRPRRDVHASRWTTGSARLPGCRRFLDMFARSQNCLMGRAKIVRLPAGGQADPQVGRGAYYRLRDRYHLVLGSAVGSVLRAGGEEVRMREGELWWFDNKQVHEVINEGEEDCIHFIFDLLPRHLAHEAIDPGTAAAPG